MTGKITQCDIAIAGGGLSGGLIAFALAQRHPELDVRLVEADSVLGGGHIWSFFDSDIAPADHWIVEPLISYKWQSYEVRFPAFHRSLKASYNSIDSVNFDKVLRRALPPEWITQARVSKLSSSEIALDDGNTIKARLIIDARGPGNLTLLNCGWQKFVGQTYHVPGGHGLSQPIVMDASVDQIDGYRFIYCLPFSSEMIFIEDTYYSDTPDLDIDAIRRRIADYAHANGWKGARSNHEETGVLPVIIGGSFDAYWTSTGQSIAKAGLRAGLCQPVTGYSLPDAVRLASLVAANPDMTPVDFQNHAFGTWKSRGFYRMLDAMLFKAAAPHARYRILQRFYALSEGLIGRFYASQSSWLDKVRLLSGKPPVPIGRALRAILENRF